MSMLNRKVAIPTASTTTTKHARIDSDEYVCIVSILSLDIHFVVRADTAPIQLIYKRVRMEIYFRETGRTLSSMFVY